MKLRSRKITIGASISAMLLAGAVIVGAAEYKTTDTVSYTHLTLPTIYSV